MTQQINLLGRKKRVASSFLIALVVLGGVVGILIGLWATRQADVTQAQAAEVSSQQRLQAAQAALQALTQKSGNDVAAELAALKAKAEAAEKILSLASELGNQQGYAAYFAALAGVNEEGVWLTSVAISNGGKTVSLQGRAMQKEAVMRYVEKLNAAFVAYGAQFGSLELSPESSGAAGAGSAKAQPLTTVSFKLNR